VRTATPTELRPFDRASASQAIWAATVLLSAAFAILILTRIRESTADGQMPLNDFFAIWCFAKYAAAHGAQGIYDPSTLHGFMQSLDDSLRQHYPYSYPPSFLLMIWPLGLVGQGAAYAAWMAGTFGLYLLASFERDRPWPSFFVAIAPATMIDLYLGQTGFLSSALIVGGFRLLKPLPVLAGILFGLVSFKPQLGILLPIALVAARQWRAIAGAAGTIALLVIASGILFGWSSWLEWIATLPSHSHYVETAVNQHYKATLTATLEMAGFSAEVAHIVQASAALAVAGIIWICFRRGSGRLTPAALMSGTFLAAPYAFFYDLPMLTNAALAASRRRSSPAETFILALSILFPIVMLLTWRLWPIPLPAIILLFGLIVRRVLRADPGN
jgi:hypothetical protein